MGIVGNIFLFSLIIFDIYKFKDVYKEIKARQIERKKIKKRLQTKKMILNQNLQELKTVDLESPLYAQFTPAEMTYFLKVTQKLKEENEVLFIFASDLLKHVKIENMRNFIKSAPFITIQQCPLKEAKRTNGKIRAGSYFPQKKKIEIYLDSDNSTLYHELLHVASSDFSYNASGFNIYLKNGGSLGKGLNEGYTELLNQRFFNKNSNSYIRLIKLAELIELFYENKEDMVTDYFNADLLGLIGELLKTMSLEEAIDIIVDIDSFLDNKMSTLDYLKLKQKILKLYEKNQNIKTQKQLVKNFLNKKAK